MRANNGAPGIDQVTLAWRCGRSTPRRPRPRRWNGSWSSVETWGARYPAIVRLWENAWAEFVPFLNFDVEIRKIICTTNAIESVNARIRRAVKARGHFPNEAAALKCVYMAIMSLDPTGPGNAAGRCAGSPR